MKKYIRPFFAVLIACCVVLMVTNAVFAFPIPRSIPSVPDPYAVPSIEGAAFTSQVVNTPDLPGVVLLGSGQYSPTGYKEGDAQIGGAGLTLSGLGKGVTSQVCFPFRNYNYQWTGVISQWNGTKWVKMATYFPVDADGVTNWACAKGASNGTFTLITWYYGPPEPAYNIIPDSIG